MILACQNISKAFGTNEILKDASFHIEEREKAALVGINGAGKSTLFKIIVGEMTADTGEVILSKGKTLGYLAQHQDLTGDLTIYEEVLQAKQDLIRMEERLRALEEEMKHEQGERLEELMNTYTRLSHTFELENGYAYRSEVVGVLKGLGFEPEEFEKKVSKHIINEENIKKEDVLKLDKQRVFDEWDSQIACFIRMFKQRPTHLDSHMGYHRTVEFREVYLALAQKYKIPVRGGEAPFPSIMRAYNVNGTTRFVRGWSGKELPYGTLKNKLLELKKSSDPLKDVIEITCHPGYVDDVLCARSHLTVGRKHDYNEVLDIYKTNWLKKNGFELVSFNNL